MTLNGTLRRSAQIVAAVGMTAALVQQADDAAVTPRAAPQTAAPAAVTQPPVAGQMATGCRYPQVCIYPDGQLSHPSGKFVDVTGGWQYLNRSFGARSFRNTRHDDVAYIKTTSGRVICVRPGANGGLYDGGATAIRISWRPTCR